MEHTVWLLSDAGTRLAASRPLGPLLRAVFLGARVSEDRACADAPSEPRRLVSPAFPLDAGQVVLFQVRLDVLLRLCLVKKVTNIQWRLGRWQERTKGGLVRRYLLVCTPTPEGPQHRDLPAPSGPEHRLQRRAGVGELGGSRELQLGQFHQVGRALPPGSVLLLLPGLFLETEHRAAEHTWRLLRETRRNKRLFCATFAQYNFPTVRCDQTARSCHPEVAAAWPTAGGKGSAWGLGLSAAAGLGGLAGAAWGRGLGMAPNSRQPRLHLLRWCSC